MDEKNTKNTVPELKWCTLMDTADLQAYAEDGIYFECSSAQIVLIMIEKQKGLSGYEI